LIQKKVTPGPDIHVGGSRAPGGFVGILDPLPGEALASSLGVRQFRAPLVILLLLAIAQIFIQNEALTRAIELIFLVWVTVPGGKFSAPPQAAHPEAA
jgi:hypothetical protein